jgi:MFS family permease
MSDEQSGAGPDEPKESAIVKYFKDFRILKETKREYWGLQLINMLDCLAYFAMFNIATVTLSNDFGFSDTGAGLIYTLFSSLTTIFLFFSGVITDWLGIKRALYISFIGLLLLRTAVVVTEYMDEPARLDTATELAGLNILSEYDSLPLAPGAPDLRITARNGTAFEVDLGTPRIVGEVIERINEAPGNHGVIEARIAPGWTGLRLVDLTDSPIPSPIMVEPTPANPDAASWLRFDPHGGDPHSSSFDTRRIISDLDGLRVDELNQGRGLEGGTTLIITDRAGRSVTIDHLDAVETVRELIRRLQTTVAAAGVAVDIDFNPAGNGLRVIDQSKDSNGNAIKEDHLIVAGDAAKALRLAGDNASSMISGGNIVANRTRNILVITLMGLMAPFMAMVITVFQAGNRRFTTKKSRGAGFNLWYLFMNVGAAGGGFLIDIIYLGLGLPHFHVFTFGIFTGILCLISIALFIRNTDQLRSPDEEAAEAEAKGEADATSDGIPELDPVTGEPKKAKKKGMGPWEITKAVLSEPIFWRFTVLITLLLGVRAVFLYLGLLFPKFWYRVIGPEAAVGQLQAFNPILVIIGLVLVIPILQRFNVYKMLVFGALITSLSMFIPAVPPLGGIGIVEWTYGSTIVFLLILTVGELIWSPRLSEYTAAIAPEGQEGTYLGLSMVPYFAAKLFVSALSGPMLERWCPEFPPGEPTMGQRIAAGEVPFWDTPYVMWVILGAAALFGVIIAILGKPWFTKGAHLE